MIHHAHLEADSITVQDLERCMDRVAVAIVKAGEHGAGYLPVYQRLEYELAAARERDGMLSSVRERAARLIASIE